MRPLKILIVEDDLLYATEVEMFLTSLGYEVLPILDSAELALSSLDKLEPDLIISDIYLKGRLTGLEFAQAIKDKGIPLIIITSSEDRKVYDEAQGLLPSAFLVKPFNQLSLQSAIENALMRKGEPLLMAQVMDQWRKDQLIREYIFVRRGTSLIKLAVNNIDLIEADGNYCYIFEGGRKFAIKLSLRRIKAKLKDSSFIQVNRNFLVNFDRIIEVDFVENLVKTELRNLTVGSTYRSEIEAWMNKV